MLLLRKIVYNKNFNLLIIEPESLTITATVLMIESLPENLQSKFNELVDYCIEELSLEELKYFVYTRETDNFNIEDTNKNVIIKVVSELESDEQLKIEDFITECLNIINE
jgi:hypothetical protein